MITHSPESPMPEPYKTYVRQRAETIATVLEPVVGDTDMQLCSRAITPDERVFGNDSDALIYGCVVEDARDGLKTALYSGHEFAQGIAAYSPEEALRYANQLLREGHKVRIKDPHESDGDGQLVAETIEEVAEAVDSYKDLANTGLVLMPDLERILNRYSAGRINLGKHGLYHYYGHEYTTRHNDRTVFGGGDILLARDDNKPRLEVIADKHEIPPLVRELAGKALDFYAKQIVYMGRASVDVIDGIAHNGSRLVTVVDPTPRVGGHTGTESLAIAALKESRNSKQIVRAMGKLLYDPTYVPRTEGTNFVDTPSLAIHARVLGVEY